MQPPAPIATDIVLLGAGATHRAVLRRFARRPQPGIRLTLVTPEPETPCAGLLPALLGGDRTAADACIDLAPLAMAAGARLIMAEATGLDLEKRTLELAGRPPLPFDLLSADLAGESAMPDPPDGCLPVSPAGRFLAQLPALEAALPDGARLAVIGGGTAGSEDDGTARSEDDGPAVGMGGHRTGARGDDTAAVALALTLAQRFRGRLRVVLVSETPEPLAGAPLLARRAARAALVEAGVELASAVRAGALTDGRLALSDGSFLAADVALWAGGTLGPGFLAESGLACDAAGRVLVNAGQRSVSHPCIFAAGDCAAQPHDRSSGRLVSGNLRRAAQGRALHGSLRWRPPPRVVPAMLDLGGGRAVAWCNGLAVSGAAVWSAKAWLDRRRMRSYAPGLAPPGHALRLPALPHSALHAALRHPALRWPALPHAALRWPASRHAAIQPGAAPPAAMLDGLSHRPAPDMLVGPGTPDHAAVLTPPVGQALVQSVTWLRACLDDPFVFGQIAAAHALSDLHAMGAQPWTALAIATVPSGVTMPADADAILAGVSDTLFTDGCTLVGARRATASEASLGLVLSGLGDPARLLRKSGSRPGDVLLLTKPLGTGIVLAAFERGVARGRWLAAAIDAMRTSNAAAARVLRAHGATACAGVGERGLVGHLDDMLRAARVAAVVWPDMVPALPGALELAAAGVAAPAASRNALALPAAGADRQTALLADPQISGGLLAVVPPARAEACLAALHADGLSAAIVGLVEAAAPGAPAIRLEPGRQMAAGGRHACNLLMPAQ
ncbi:MAG: selenide, water dikinase SelD [Acetobacteraceae bacterium]|jgi:selenide,water dikinase